MLVSKKFRHDPATTKKGRPISYSKQEIKEVSEFLHHNLLFIWKKIKMMLLIYFMV